MKALVIWFAVRNRSLLVSLSACVVAMCGLVWIVFFVSWIQSISEVKADEFTLKKNILLTFVWWVVEPQVKSHPHFAWMYWQLFFFYWGLVVLVWENAVAVDVQFTCQVLANEVVIEEEKKNGKVFVAISNNTTFPLWDP